MVSRILTLLVLALHTVRMREVDCAKIVSLNKNCSTHHKYEEGLLGFFYITNRSRSTHPLALLWLLL